MHSRTNYTFIIVFYFLIYEKSRCSRWRQVAQGMASSFCFLRYQTFLVVDQIFQAPWLTFSLHRLFLPQIRHLYLIMGDNDHGSSWPLRWCRQWLQISGKNHRDAGGTHTSLLTGSTQSISILIPLSCRLIRAGCLLTSQRRIRAEVMGAILGLDHEKSPSQTGAEFSS